MKRLKKLQPYSGTNEDQNIHDYFVRLEHLIQSSFDIPPDSYEANKLKADILLTKVTEPARAHIDSNLTQAQKEDLHNIIDELQNRFEFSRDETYYQNLLEAIPSNGVLPFVVMMSKNEQLVKKLIQTNTKDIRESSAEYKLLYEHLSLIHI